LINYGAAPDPLSVLAWARVESGKKLIAIIRTK
jgi:hypothetical protein